jgi:hypothetical protein
MTGLPDSNYPAFDAVAEVLRALNFRVENPTANAQYAPADVTYSWYLKAGLLQLLRCRSIILLPGWENSRGAQLEHTVAEALGLQQYEWKDVEAWAAVTPFRLGLAPS